MPKKKPSKPQTATITITEDGAGIRFRVAFNPALDPKRTIHSQVMIAAALCLGALKAAADVTAELE